MRRELLRLCCLKYSHTSRLWLHLTQAAHSPLCVCANISKVALITLCTSPKAGLSDFFLFTQNKSQHLLAPAGVAQWMERWPENQKDAGSSPSQGTGLGCGPGPQWGACERQLIDVLMFPSFFLLSPLSKNK